MEVGVNSLTVILPGFDPEASAAPVPVWSVSATCPEFEPELPGGNGGSATHPVQPVLSPPAPPGTAATLPFYAALKACRACTCRAEATQVVPGEGPLDARILILGQGPGGDEDAAGRPFVGPAGQELDTWLRILDLPRAGIYISNAVKCATTKNRPPTAKELKTCTNLWLAQELEALTAVTVLLPVGKPAIVAVLGKDAPPLTPLMAHHYRIQTCGRELRVFPLPHPAFLLRAIQLGPLFRETILGHVKLTMEQEVAEEVAWTRKGS